MTRLSDGTMNRKKNIRITIGASLMILGMSFFLYKSIDDYIAPNIEESKLISFDGTMVSIEEKVDGGLRKHEKLIYQLQS